jgi:hypothetical protein
MLTCECTITTLRSPILASCLYVQLTNFTKGLFLSSHLGGTKSVHDKKGHKIICYVSFRPHCKKETKR